MLRPMPGNTCSCKTARCAAASSSRFLRCSSLRVRSSSRRRSSSCCFACRPRRMRARRSSRASSESASFAATAAEIKIYQTQDEANQDLIAGRIEYVKGLRRQASPVNRPTAAEGAKSLVS